MRKLLMTTLVVLAAVTMVSADRASDLEKNYLATIDELIPGMAAKEIVDREEPQQKLERMCFDVGGPGKELERKALCSAMAKRLDPDTPMLARVWMLRKLDQLGREEVVDVLSNLLSDEDDRIRELTRGALQNNPVPAAAAALREELRKTPASNTEWRVGLINALGWRADADSVDTLREYVASEQPAEVAGAAMVALARIGTDEAIEILVKMSDSDSDALNETLRNARFEAAERLLDRGEKSQATAIYNLYIKPAHPERVRIAALQGLVRSQGADVLPRLFRLMSGPDDRLKLAAYQCAIDVEGSSATAWLAGRLETANAAMRVRLLEILAQRGDRTALASVVKMANSDQKRVRIEGLVALAHLADASVVKLLVERAAGPHPSEANPARESLHRAAGKDIDEAILAMVPNAEPAVHAELIKAIAARRIASGTPLLLEAIKSKEDLVRAAGISALSDLGEMEDLPGLVQMLVEAEGAQTRQAAETAVTRVCMRVEDPENRAEPVIKALGSGGPDADGSLLRVLGVIQGKAAFEAVRSSLKSDEAVVAESAVTALSQWRDPIARDTLWDIAKSSTQPARREMALSGAIRLIREDGGMPPEKKCDWLIQAMDLSDRTDSRRSAIRAMGTAPTIKALEFLNRQLEDPTVRQVAAEAALDVAVRISGQHPDDALATIRRIESLAITEELTAVARRVLDRMTSYCVSWMISGPYRMEGVKGGLLMEQEFTPEDDVDKAEWRPQPITTLDQPGRFDFGENETNCCVYLKTKVWVPSGQKAQFAVGSDDGIKVWVNDDVVHVNNVSRGVTCDEDRFEVVLDEGWNDVLLKVTQGSGGFGFCCAVRTPDGKIVEGLKFKAD